MKKIITWVLVLFLLTACGQKAPAWQEQYDLGVRCLTEGSYGEAIIAFKVAIEIEPKRAEAYIGLYDAYVAIGDYESAQAAIDSGREKCGNRTEFDDAQTSLDLLFRDDPEMQMYIDSEKLSETLRSGVLTFDDLPAVFSTPFNQLGGLIGVPSGDIGTTTQSGSFRGLEYEDLSLQKCDYRDYELTSGYYIRATAPLSGSAVLDFSVDGSTAVLNGEAIAALPAGWKEITIGDSMETVLSKLGLDSTLSRYSGIDLWITRDETESHAWVDSAAWTFRGDIPIMQISVQFGSGSDDSDIEYSVVFDFVDGGPLSAVHYLNFTLYDALLNGGYEGSAGEQTGTGQNSG